MPQGLVYKDFMDYKTILHDIFVAYYDARKHKRGSVSQIDFEIDYERKLLALAKELADGTYKISPSICFISFKPLKREIFAADFRDRIVHHLIYNYINPFFENSFINDSYSCRVGKGTSYGIRRLDHFIRSCSSNYSKDTYVLKLDIKGYFMSINKHILYLKIRNKLSSHKIFSGRNSINRSEIIDMTWLLLLIHQVIFHDPTKDCIIKGKKENWNDLPKSKSLFGAKPDTGLPIGNLTSQLFGNIYLDDFDHFVKYGLRCKYYGRYVDDIVIIYSDLNYLKLVIQNITNYLLCELFLEIHPKKIYLQNIKSGVSFLGAYIKPYRIYVRNRIKGNFYKKIQTFNMFLHDRPSNIIDKDVVKIVATTNSYLGMLKQYDTYKLRKKIVIECTSPNFREYIRIDENFDIVSKKLE